MNTFVLTELFGTLTFYVEAPLRRFTRAICGLRNVVLLCEVLQSIAFVAAFAELWCSESVVELERIHRLFFTAIGYKLCHFFIFTYYHYRLHHEDHFALQPLLARFA